MPDFTVTVSAEDAAFLSDLATAEGTDVNGLLSLRSEQLVQYRKDAVARAVLSSRIAKLLHAGPVLLNAVDNVALPGGTNVAAELRRALDILGRR